VAIDVSRTTIVQWAIATLADPETSKANASLLLPFVVRSLLGKIADREFSFAEPKLSSGSSVPFFERRDFFPVAPGDAIIRLFLEDIES